MAKSANTVSKSDAAINHWYGQMKKIKLREKFEIPESDATTQCLSANKPDLKLKERNTDPCLTTFVAESYKDRQREEKRQHRKFMKTVNAKAKELNLPVEVILKHPNLSKK